MYRKVNLNGTSKDELLEQYRRVAEACRELKEALARATPHGRDFQLNEEDFQPARMVHTSHQIAVEDIEAHVADVVNNLWNQ